MSQRSVTFAPQAWEDFNHWRENDSATEDKIWEIIKDIHAHPDNLYFIHQHIADAQTAQTADANTKSIAIVYALIGLSLMIEKTVFDKATFKKIMELARTIFTKGND